MNEHDDQPLPILPLALITCDAIAKDELLNRHTIIGIYGAVVFSSFPAVLPILRVYAAFSEVRGKVKIEVHFIDANGEILARITLGDVATSDPMEVLELKAQFINLKIKSPGHYFVRLLANEMYIMERRLLVLEAAPKEQQ